MTEEMRPVIRRHGGTGLPASGLFAGTQIATAAGWRCAETLQAGDLIMTFDHGIQPLKEIRRSAIWSQAFDVPRIRWPLHVPAGALGNSVIMELLPDQGVLIESASARDARGDPFAVVPARTLETFRGIRSVPPPQVATVLYPVFERDQVVYADGGALLHCARPEIRLDEMLAPRSPEYEVREGAAARELVAAMIVDDPSQGTWPDGVPGFARAH